jgi:HD superfamily phosphohydrolase YqeK
MDDDEWAKLSKADRLEHCLRTAREAENSAKTEALAMRDIYARLAAQWHLLAAKIEREEENGPAA